MSYTDEEAEKISDFLYRIMDLDYISETQYINIDKYLEHLQDTEEEEDIDALNFDKAEREQEEKQWHKDNKESYNCTLEDEKREGK